MNLSEISHPIKSELKEFSGLFKSSMKSNVGLLNLITAYILKQKGKKVRPMLVLLSAKACGEITPGTYRGASLVELLHTATLVHDDVVDNAEKRRGFPSINAVWKNKIAVLMGDYLLSRGLMIAIEGHDYEFLRTITGTVKKMSEGELLQIQKTRKLDIDEETYFRIISDKTASLLQTCCVIGAMSATENSDYHSALADFGEYLGIAFQIKDDILDFNGKFQLFGKTIGADIREKKITLPLIYALNNVSTQEAGKIRGLIKNNKKEESVKKIIDFVYQNGGIEYAEKTAREYAVKGESALNALPDSDSKNSLKNLLKFVVSREN